MGIEPGISRNTLLPVLSGGVFNGDLVSLTTSHSGLRSFTKSTEHEGLMEVLKIQTDNQLSTWVGQEGIKSDDQKVLGFIPSENSLILTFFLFSPHKPMLPRFPTLHN